MDIRRRARRRSMDAVGLVLATLMFSVAFVSAAAADPVSVKVTVTNQAPADGIYLTPFFVAFQNGSFDLYNDGQAVGSGGLPAGLESVAEDGINPPLENDFAASSAAATGGISATIDSDDGPFAGAAVGNVYGPGNQGTRTFSLDPDANRYFSFASMVIPSNDAFIGNDDPEAFQLFDADGNLQDQDILVIGPTDVLDAGTEQNTEMNAAFLNQMMADAGITENGVVSLHPGLHGSVRNPDATPVLILGGTNPLGIHFDTVAADFTRAGYPLARISITAAAVPAPDAMWLMPIGLLAIVWLRRRSRRAEPGAG